MNGVSWSKTLWSIAVMLAVAGFSSAAQATVQRTFVSTSGSDVNACSLVAPCRSFGAAITATSPGGEVIALDSGGYGSFTIGKAVSVIAPTGVYAGISVFSGQDGITVSAGPNDLVVVRGLSINNQGGDIGIRISSGGFVHVESCVINGMFSGILMLASTAIELRVLDTIIRASTNNGIDSEAVVAAGTGSTLEIARSVFEENADVGIWAIDMARTTISDTIVHGMSASRGVGVDAIISGIGPVATIERTVMSGGDAGLVAHGAGAVNAVVNVSNSIISNNQGPGLWARDKSHVRLAATQITGNGTGVLIEGSGIVSSLGNNMRAGNTINGGAASSITPY